MGLVQMWEILMSNGSIALADESSTQIKEQAIHINPGGREELVIGSENATIKRTTNN